MHIPSERSQSNKAVYYVITTIYYILEEAKNCGNNKNKISGCQRLGVRGGTNRWSTGDIEGSEITLYDIMMDICHYTFAQIHRMYNIKRKQ